MPIMKRMTRTLLFAGAALLAGCFSMDIATTDALQESALSSRDGKVLEHVVVSNYGWFLFNFIPLACGNANPKAAFPWTFFSDQVSSRLLHDRLMSYAASQCANVKELAFFRDYYAPLIPACLIVYDRTAYFEPGGDLRLTIDDRPRYRTEDLTLTHSLDGFPLLDAGWTILEVKVQGAMPLWLSAALSEGQIFKASFSKYGEAWRQEQAMEKTRQNRPELLGTYGKYYENKGK